MKYPILLPNIFDHPFTYESSLKLKTGEYVNVPFGRKTITGVVWDQFEKNSNKKKLPKKYAMMLMIFDRTNKHTKGKEKITGH